jgi:hypothetical protein
VATDQRFGYGLALVDGDIAFDVVSAPGAPTSRLAPREVAGTANLMQALVLRVQTPFGSDRYNTTYGLDVRQAFTEPGTVRVIKDLIRMNLVRTLGTDPRVRDVRDVQFEDEDAYRQRHPELAGADGPDPRHRRVWQVDVLLETADGATQTLAATIGV